MRIGMPIAINTMPITPKVIITFTGVNRGCQYFRRC